MDTWVRHPKGLTQGFPKWTISPLWAFLKFQEAKTKTKYYKNPPRGRFCKLVWETLVYLKAKTTQAKNYFKNG